MNGERIIRHNLRSIGIMIACARLLRGESEQAVGCAVDLCAQAIHQIERGKYHSLTYQKLVDLCTYLEIPVRGHRQYIDEGEN